MLAIRLFLVVFLSIAGLQQNIEIDVLSAGEPIADPLHDSIVPHVASPLIDTGPRTTSRPPTPRTERDRLYDELAEMVDAFELRNAILRRASRFVRPSVVHIEAEKNASEKTGEFRATGTNEEDTRLRVKEAGSGVVIRWRNKNYILTNRHVIRGAELANIHIVFADGRTANPTRIRSDANTDVAVMDVGIKGLTPARIGNSNEVAVGDFVLAFGSPFGLSHSVTQGIVSAKGRRDLILGAEKVRIQDFIQTDAAINPGNSGGPLVNLRGEVIGINTAIASDSGVNAGIGFATPINIATFVGRQLVERGSVASSYLGVKLDVNFTDLDAEAAGVPRFAGTRISSVRVSSPAEEADLRVGDVVFQFNGVVVEDESHLIQLIGLTPVDSKVPFIVFRQGEPITIVVTLRAKT